MKHLIALVLVLALGSCSAHKNSDHRADSDSLKKSVIVKDTSTQKTTEEKVDTVAVRDLAYGFRVRVIGEGKVEILNHDKIIFSDTTDTYTLDEKAYPIINKIDANAFELLIETDERPSKNLLRVFKIRNNRVTKKERLPTFDGKPEVINSVLTYHGVWDDGELWDEKGKRYTVYNPPMYYKFMASGVQLDTALSIKKIREKYGRFRGFTYSGKIGYPVDNKGNITDTADRHVLKESDENQ